MHKEIIPIIQIFPDFEEKIVFLYQTDENFRDLCSDYMLCTSMVIDEEIGEFKELQGSLEEEILKMISR